jgi:hypothetical protein
MGGKSLTATLADNETARDFASALPLKVTMKDLIGREKYGDLPKALSENGPRKNKYEVGEIAYWSPDKTVRRVLSPGWRVDSFTWHHSDRED